MSGRLFDYYRQKSLIATSKPKLLAHTFTTQAGTLVGLKCVLFCLPFGLSSGKQVFRIVSEHVRNETTKNWTESPAIVRFT
jgi:hypothetical protein